MEIEKWIEENKVSPAIAKACDWMWVVNSDRLLEEEREINLRELDAEWDKGYEKGYQDAADECEIIVYDLIKTIKGFIEFDICYEDGYDKLVSKAKSTLKKYEN